MQKITVIAGILTLALLLACGKTPTESTAATQIVPKDSTISPKQQTQKATIPPKKGIMQHIVTIVHKAKKGLQALINPDAPTDSLSTNIAEEIPTPSSPERPFEMPLISLNTMMESLTTGPQAYSIPSTEPTAIQLPQGTQVYIPENAFMIEESETPVNGNVLLLAKEYLSITDILRSNLSTESPEGILETGGMLYLEAQYEGKRCALQKDKRIQFLLPTQGRKKQADMQLFSGERDEDGQLLWNALAPTDFTKQDTLSRQYTTKTQTFREYVNISADNIRNFTWVNMSRPVIKIKKVRVRQGGILTDIDENVRCPRNFFSLNEFPIKYCSVKWGEGKNDTVGVFTQKEEKAATYKVKIDADLITGNLIFPRYAGDLAGIPVGMSHYILRRIRKHRWTPGENEAEFEVFVPNKYKKILQDKYGRNHSNGDCEINYRKEYKDYIANFKPTTYYYSPPRMSAFTQLDNYIFRSSKLGWINCDRFWNTQRKTDLMVEVGNTSDLQAYLVFHKMRSICSLNNWEQVSVDQNTCLFLGVPLNEKVTILVIKTEDNKQYYALKDTYTSTKTVNDLDFYPLDREILAGITKDLGKRFD